MTRCETTCNVCSSIMLAANCGFLHRMINENILSRENEPASHTNTHFIYTNPWAPYVEQFPFSSLNTRNPLEPFVNILSYLVRFSHFFGLSKSQRLMVCVWYSAVLHWYTLHTLAIRAKATQPPFMPNRCDFLFENWF